MVNLLEIEKYTMKSRTEKFLDFLTTSSANPEKYSATFKGILLMFIPLIIFVGQSAGVPLTQTSVVELVQDLTMLMSTLLTGLGILRKIYFWFKGV